MFVKNVVSVLLLSVLLLWDPPEDSYVAGYRVYEKCSTELTLTNRFTDYTDVGLFTSMRTEIEPGKYYYFCVTAYDWIGQESEASKGIFIIQPHP